jgi:hypothetical protein
VEAVLRRRIAVRIRKTSLPLVAALFTRVIPESTHQVHELAFSSIAPLK